MTDRPCDNKFVFWFESYENLFVFHSKMVSGAVAFNLRLEGWQRKPKRVELEFLRLLFKLSTPVGINMATHALPVMQRLMEGGKR